MTHAVKTTAIVQDGGRVQIVSPELTPGARVEVIVLQASDAKRPSIDEILAGYAGGRLFQTAEQVDRYLRAERDAWER